MSLPLGGPIESTSEGDGNAVAVDEPCLRTIDPRRLSQFQSLAKACFSLASIAIFQICV